MNFSIKENPVAKVGLFALIALVLLAYVTVRVSQKSILPGGTYDIHLIVQSATGINKKTPVLIAGIQVGTVADIELVQNNKASLTIEINRGVKLSKSVEASVKTIGFLGDTYIDLIQQSDFADVLPHDGTIVSFTGGGDLTNQISDIAGDLKAITTTLKTLMAGDNSPFAKSINNIERITDVIGSVTAKNEANMNAMLANLRALSENLNLVVARNMGNVDSSLDNINAVTGKMRRGEGTIGRLFNDEETVDKLNESLDGLNNIIGGANKLKVDIGYKGEYLGQTQDVKHYVSLGLRPSPDKAFLFDFVSDPAPSPTLTIKETRVISGGTTTDVREEISTTEPDRFKVSAQFAKKFYDLTLRGGIIESTGGAGVDYTMGPATLSFQGYDFKSGRGRNAHLKAYGNVNLTNNLYLTGGLDDFISKTQKADWFMGAGFSMSDDDIKSIMGLVSTKP